MWPPGLDQMPGATSDESFCKRTQNAFESGTYSDVTVTCKQRKWRVHKLQLVQHSPVFETMLQGLSKSASVLDLRDEDPDAVNHMLRYMYFHSYIALGQEGNIIENMRVHKIANKYQIPGLAKEAMFRYGVRMVFNLTLGEFSAAIKEAYASDGYDEFRETFVERIATVVEEKSSKPEVYKKFWEMIEETPQFAMDLLRSGKLVDKSTRCKSCDQHAQEALDSADYDSS